MEELRFCCYFGFISTNKFNDFFPTNYKYILILKYKLLHKNTSFLFVFHNFTIVFPHFPQLPTFSTFKLDLLFFSVFLFFLFGKWMSKLIYDKLFFIFQRPAVHISLSCFHLSYIGDYFSRHWCMFHSE